MPSATTASPTGSAATSSASSSPARGSASRRSAARGGDGADHEPERASTSASSWGGATIPDDAASAHEAMQLADLRMYAQKESRRDARDRQDPIGETTIEDALDAAALGGGAVEA